MEQNRTANPLMQEVLAKIRLVAPTDTTVLLTGETGTGKSFLAKMIHRLSLRSNLAFVCVHATALPETLVESELFGHEKGAFTGAYRKKLGKFELAKEGTLFLDEIGTLPPTTQIKLLKVLEEGTFERVGGAGIGRSSNLFNESCQPRSLRCSKELVGYFLA